MSVNSSSFADISFVPPHLSSNSSLHLLLNECFSSRTSIFVISAFSITYILLLLPLLILVLYLGYQQWRKQRSSSTTATTHCDIITYHSIAMQLNEVLGLTLFFCGGFVKLTEMMFVGFSIWSVTCLGQGLFQMLTCVMRYLAVVHPVTYLGLKQTGGIRIRNIVIGCVWALCFGWPAVIYGCSFNVSVILYFCIVTVFLVVVSFCSISVLCALKRPGPGEVGGDRERVDQSKQRAFHTITAIMGVLMFSSAGYLIANVMYTYSVFSDMCGLLMFTIWFDLPIRLVLPLLFLQRAGKLQCCKKITKSGRGLDHT